MDDDSVKFIGFFSFWDHLVIRIAMFIQHTRNTRQKCVLEIKFISNK